LLLPLLLADFFVSPRLFRASYFYLPIFVDLFDSSAQVLIDVKKDFSILEELGGLGEVKQ